MLSVNGKKILLEMSIMLKKLLLLVNIAVWEDTFDQINSMG